MNSISWIFCQAFLQKCPPEKRSGLIAYLPEEKQGAFAHALPASFNPLEGIPPPETLLDQIHYTWLAPFLRTLPENDIRLYFSALHESHAKPLKKALLFSTSLLALTPLATRFLRQTLLRKITDVEGEILPVECLPKSPMLPLLQFNYEELLSIIDLLGIHDLAVEIRQIIDTSLLKKIYATLSKEQNAFLKTLSQKKEPLAFKKMTLANWDGNASHLKTMLQQRGLNRLAKALYGETPSFLWHLMHRLDLDRANMLKNLCKPLDHPQASHILRNQITDLMHSIKNSTPH
jgi:hypothetical protein